jgi:hypothetical protein
LKLVTVLVKNNHNETIFTRQMLINKKFRIGIIYHSVLKDGMGLDVKNFRIYFGDQAIKRIVGVKFHTYEPVEPGENAIHANTAVETVVPDATFFVVVAKPLIPIDNFGKPLDADNQGGNDPDKQGGDDQDKDENDGDDDDHGDDQGDNQDSDEADEADSYDQGAFTMSAAPSLPRFLGDVDRSRAPGALESLRRLSGIRSQKRVYVTGNGGSSHYLGFLRRGVVTAHRHEEANTAALSANCLLYTSLKKEPFTWTSMAINIGTVSAPHVDRNKKGSVSVIMGLGDYTGGDFVQGGINYDIKNKILLFDGAVEHHSTPFEGERVTIVFFTHRNWNAKNLQKHFAKLTELGFASLPRGVPITMEPSVALPAIVDKFMCYFFL